MVPEEGTVPAPIETPPPAPVIDTPAPQAPPATPVARQPINAGAVAQDAPAQPYTPPMPARADGVQPINVEPQAPAQPAATEIPPTTPTAPDPSQAAPQNVAGLEPNPTTPATPAAQPTAPVADWEALTGGKLKTQADWETFQAEQARLAAEVQQLSTSRVEPANPLVAKINDVFKSGGDVATVANIIKAQSIDPASMKPLEAIKASISFQHPDLDADEVEAHIAGMGIDLSDMEGAGTRAAIKTQAAKATQYLQSLKVEMDNPAVIKQAQESQAERVRQQEAWKAVPVPQPTTKINEKVGNIDVSIDVPLSAEATAFAAQFTNEYRNSLPATTQNIQNYTSLFELIARGFDADRIIAESVKTAVEKAVLEVKKSVAGPTPPPVPQAAPPEPVRPRQNGHFSLGGI